MKLLTKVAVATSITLLLSSSSAFASSTYTVKSGDTLLGIVYKLGFNSIEEAGFKVPSGDINKIFPGDQLGYKGKKKKSRFKSKAKIDLDKFCFKDNRSIHYKSTERCK